MKILLKRLLVPILSRRPVSTIATRIFGSGVPVFLLHRMTSDGHSNAGKITAEHLRRCINYLVDNGYTLISVEQLVLALKNKQPLPPKAAAFTIDDGYADQAEIAAPIFLEFNCPLTIFIITGLLDQTLWPWDAQVSWIFETSVKHLLETDITGQALTVDLKDNNSSRVARRKIQHAIRNMNADLVPGIVEQLARDANVTIPENAPSSYLPMNWETARQLEKKGVQFAPHSVTHNILSRLAEETMEKEIRDSWQTMKKELTRPLKVFCYPSGRDIDFGNREKIAVKKAGFLGAVSTIPGFVEPKNKPKDQLFSLPRFALPDSMDDFVQYCTWIEYVKSTHKFR